MKICFITKYPPIEGGVSSKSYWLAKSLGERGHEVYVVTNSWEVEDEYREVIPKEDFEKLEPKNVKVFSTKHEQGYDFIPYSNPYVTKLSGLAINVIRKYNVDLIYSFYLQPYCVAGYIAKKTTKKPLMVMHAGSDIERLFENKFMKSVFIEVFNTADVILSDSRVSEKIKGAVTDHEKIKYLNLNIPSNEFAPQIEPYKELEKGDSVLFTYLGKNYDRKGTDYFLKAVKSSKKNIKALFLVGKKSIEIIKKRSKELKIEDRVILKQFIAPWKIPNLMAASDVIVCPFLSHNIEIKNSTIPLEAMACGRPVILGEEICKKSPFNECKNWENLVKVKPEDIENFSKTLDTLSENKKLREKIGENGNIFIRKRTNYSKSIEEFIDKCNFLVS